MRLSNRFKIGIAAVLLVVFLVILNLADTQLKGIKNFFYLISSPVQKTFWQAGENVSDFFAGILESQTIKEENKKIYFKNQALLAENLLLKELKKENETLRIALNLELAKDFQLKLAKVVSKDVAQDSILIDKGAKDGILKGAPVITAEKTILGRIGQIYDNFSEVVLISNKESTFDAKITEKDIFGVIKGKGSGEIYFDLIPKEEEISEGDLVVTSALGGIFPEGLLVGQIKKVEKSDLEIWQRAEIASSFQLKNLAELFIITEF